VICIVTFPATRKRKTPPQACGSRTQPRQRAVAAMPSSFIRTIGSHRRTAASNRRLRHWTGSADPSGGRRSRARRHSGECVAYRRWGISPRPEDVTDCRKTGAGILALAGNPPFRCGLNKPFRFQPNRESAPRSLNGQSVPGLMLTPNQYPLHGINNPPSPRRRPGPSDLASHSAAGFLTAEWLVKPTVL
jgi:hypothetical protein